MEFIKVANEIQRLSYLFYYNKDSDLFYDLYHRPVIYEEQWNAESELYKSLSYEEKEMFLNLLAVLCPGD